MPRSTHHETKTLMKITHGALLTGVVLLGACSEPTVSDYNNPGQEAYEVVSTRAQLEAQAVGLADVDRRSHDFQILINETIGRNFYRMDGAEPRYISQTLRGSLPSNSNFIGSAVFTGPFRTIRSAEFLIKGVRAAADSLPETLGGAKTAFTAQDKAATIGYAYVWTALSYIRLIEQRDTIGIPIYAGPDSVAPIRFKDDVLRHISVILDSAHTQLATAGNTEFKFNLPVGFNGFRDAASFNKFAYALQARNEVYRAFDLFARTAAGAARDTTDFSGIDQAALVRAQAALDASFFDINGDLVTGGTGVYHTYAAGGDYLNPNFDPTIYRINPRVVKEAEGATVTVINGDSIWSSPDQRLVRKVELNGSNNCLARSSVRSCFLDKVNATNITPLPIIRNDELILLQAEIFWGQGNYLGALDVVNRVRTAAGLPVRTALSFGDATFTTSVSRRALLREILKQKRYQLLLESGSRWIDMRMFGLLAEMGEERGTPSTGVPVLPIPLSERLARGNNVTKVDMP